MANANIVILNTYEGIQQLKCFDYLQQLGIVLITFPPCFAC